MSGWGARPPTIWGAVTRVAAPQTFQLSQSPRTKGRNMTTRQKTKTTVEDVSSATPGPELVQPESPLATDDELLAQILALDRERDALEVERGQPRAFVDDGHAAIAASVAAARRVVDEKLYDALHYLPLSEGTIPVGLADAYLLASEPAIAERWHELLDGGMPSHRAEVYRRDLSRVAYTAERRRIAAEIATRQGELDRRARAAKRAALDAEDAAAEATPLHEEAS